MAPEVLGTTLPPGSRGKAVDLPAFLGGGGGGNGMQGPEQLLIQWEVQSDQGTGQVLLLARAAHCMRRIAEARAARSGVGGGAEFEVRAGGWVVGWLRDGWGLQVGWVLRTVDSLDAQFWVPVPRPSLAAIFITIRRI
jgi:hypothetical protein